MIILLIGIPGAGKGTQGRILSKLLNLPHVSIGDIFRNIAKDNSKEAVEINEIINKGQLVPNKYVNNIIKKLLLEDYKNGCVLDGYPRNIEQAKFLFEITASEIKVILFEIDNKIAIDRILNRYSCKNCGAIYNNLINKTSECLSCGSTEFTIRNDDNSEIITNRIRIYNEETYPIVQYFKANSKVYKINTNYSMEEINNQLTDLIKKLKSD